MPGTGLTRVDHQMEWVPHQAPSVHPSIGLLAPLTFARIASRLWRTYLPPQVRAPEGPGGRAPGGSMRC